MENPYKSKLDKEADHMISGFAGSECLDEKLISELSTRGMPEKDLKMLRDQGFHYFRETNSFFLPMD